MRHLLIALATVSTLSAMVPVAATAGEYCLQGKQKGYPGDCSFRTYAQCQATASGTDSGCGINPGYAVQQHQSRHRAW